MQLGSISNTIAAFCTNYTFNYYDKILQWNFNEYFNDVF